MAASLVTSNTFVFSDGNTGHSCNLGSGPTAGQEDVLFVNSDATVTTPAGFTATSNVSNQGVYSFRRIAAGGEASTVTITTSAGVPAAVHWSRWNNITAVDDAASTRIEDGGGSSTPSHTTGTLSASGEIMFAFAALHDIGSADQNTPVWSSGYTALTAAIQGTGATGVSGFLAYKLNAGTAPETPSVSWSGSACKDRVMLTLSFTATAGGSTQNATATSTTTATVTSAAAATHAGSATFAATATVASAAAASRPAGSTSTTAATVTAVAAGTHLAASTVSTTGTVTAAASAVHAAAGAVTATGTITTAASAAMAAGAGLAATGTVMAAGASARSAAAAVTVTATITAAATVVPPLDDTPDTDYTIGRPQTAWHIGPPRTTWAVDTPHTTWTVGRPR